MRRALPAMVAVVLAVLAAGGLSQSARAASAAGPTVTAQQVTVRYGPFTLPAGSMAKPGEINNLQVANKPCVACDITGMKPDLVYPDGTEANMDTGPMLHHFVISNLFGTDSTCGAARPGGQRIFSAGNERTDKELPAGYGLHVAASDTWVLLSDLMNYASTPQTVYISITFTYAPANSTTPVKAEWLDVTGCAGFSYYGIPAGASTKSWTWTSNITGRIVFINGHQHDNGQHIVATDLTTGATICDSVPEYGQMGGMQTIMSMGKCAGDPVAVIHTGDKIQITSYYDSPTAQNDVMGIMHAYVASGA